MRGPYGYAHEVQIHRHLPRPGVAHVPAAAPRPRSGSKQAAGQPGSPWWVLLEAKLAKADFRSGEPIPLELTLRNASAETISIWDTSETDFRILIKGPGGARAGQEFRNRRAVGGSR